MNQFQRRLLGEDQVTDGEQEVGLFPTVMGQITTAVMQTEQTAALVIARKHEAQIETLHRQLIVKDEEIDDLRQKLLVIQEKNNDLQIKLKTKDDEVKQLQERIQTLEDEKQNLQDELDQVETKLKRLEKDMKSLNKTTKQHEEENRRLKENLQKVEFDLHSTRETLTSENEKLKREMKNLKEAKPVTPVDFPRLSLPQAPNEKSVAMLQLGELCYQLQGSMYEKVLPNDYVPEFKYKIKNIEKDVKKLPTDEEKAEAERRWRELKQNINWNDDLKETIGMVQQTRNIEAHPQISETSLRRYVEVLKNHGCLKGWLSMERVNELIEVWKRLKQLKQQ